MGTMSEAWVINEVGSNLNAIIRDNMANFSLDQMGLDLGISSPIVHLYLETKYLLNKLQIFC